jgi:hypothetical protein
MKATLCALALALAAATAPAAFAKQLDSGCDQYKGNCSFNEPKPGRPDVK